MKVLEKLRIFLTLNGIDISNPRIILDQKSQRNDTNSKQKMPQKSEMVSHVSIKGTFFSILRPRYSLWTNFINLWKNLHMFYSISYCVQMIKLHTNVRVSWIQHSCLPEPQRSKTHQKRPISLWLKNQDKAQTQNLHDIPFSKQEKLSKWRTCNSGECAPVCCAAVQ